MVSVAFPRGIWDIYKILGSGLRSFFSLVGFQINVEKKKKYPAFCNICSCPSNFMHSNGGCGSSSSDL